jgi:hypothetical protein
MHAELCELSSTFIDNPHFATWTTLLEELSPEDKGNQLRQAQTFFKFAIQTYQKHFERCGDL